jgi:hypothetical protein
VIAGIEADNVTDMNIAKTLEVEQLLQRAEDATKEKDLHNTELRTRIRYLIELLRQASKVSRQDVVDGWQDSWDEIVENGSSRDEPNHATS